MSAWGRLKVGETIGEGAFGEVYRAFDPVGGCDVALKLMRPRPTGDRPRTRALREYRNLAKVHHPNVVEAYGVGVEGRRAGLWMELVRGATLAQMLQTRGPFTGEEAAFVGQALCRALAAVHAAGLVHADVKVQNVMQAECGRTVLMDFGASLRHTATRTRRARLTGTLVYLAPEVLSGGRPSIAADIYSLGVLLFLLVTGRYPVYGSSFAELARAHAYGCVWRLKRLNPDVPDAFAEAVEGALEDISRRYRSAAEMGAALSAVVPAVPAFTVTRQDTAVAPVVVSFPLAFGNTTTRSGEWATRDGSIGPSRCSA
ncbi:MAG TPA: serine/threonine-protein kinase [Vicinamibacterales bacterium]|nr:serine/threonine-protein kinase [Vicinamibacterales bacterium]